MSTQHSPNNNGTTEIQCLPQIYPETSQPGSSQIALNMNTFDTSDQRVIGSISIVYIQSTNVMCMICHQQHSTTIIYPLVNQYNFMEKHNVSWVNQELLWPFSIANCQFTRGQPSTTTHLADKSQSPVASGIGGGESCLLLLKSPWHMGVAGIPMTLWRSSKRRHVKTHQQ